MKKRLSSVLAAALVAAALVAAAGYAMTPGSSAAAVADSDPGLGQFQRQPVTWTSCVRSADDDEGRALDKAGVQCADIRVPLDYARPAGRAITVAIARSKATDAAHYAGPLLINLGGPAQPVLSTVPLAREAMGTTGATFDIIGMDMRFSGRSSPIDCGWPASWLPRSAGVGRASFDRMVTLSQDLARRCGTADNDLLPFASTANAARDMDVIRAALGAPKLSFLGYSQGSYLGAQYAQQFPRQAGRMVLDSVIDPDRPGVTILTDAGAAGRREAALREWAGLAAQHDDQLHLGTTPEQVLGVVDHVYQAAAKAPLHVGSYLVDDTVIPGVIVKLLVDDSEENALELAATLGVLRQAADTGSAEPTDALASTLAGQLTGRDSGQRSASTAIQCGDAAVSGDVERYWSRVQTARMQAPLFGPLGSTITPCAFWPNPSKERPLRIRNDVPALVVQAAGDINATVEMGQAMHRDLRGSRMITLDGARDHGVYLFRGSDCVDTAVNAYLDTGRLPASDLTCAQ